MKLIMLGAQGSGKGTVGNILAQKLGIPLIGTGEMLRDLSPSHKYYQLFQEMMHVGGFENQDKIAELLQERLAQPDCAQGFILDGWMRRTIDYDLFNPQVDYAIYLVIPRNLSIQRITGRRVCKNDDFVCNIYSRPPKVPGKCDKCGSDLVTRDDDTEEAVNRRLDLFYSDTMTNIDRYRADGKLIEVPAEGVAEEIAEVVLSLLPHDKA